MVKSVLMISEKTICFLLKKAVSNEAQKKVTKKAYLIGCISIYIFQYLFQQISKPLSSLKLIPSSLFFIEFSSGTMSS